MHIGRTWCLSRQEMNKAKAAGLTNVFGHKAVVKALRAVGSLRYFLSGYSRGFKNASGGAYGEPWAPEDLVEVAQAAMAPWASFYGPVELPPRRRLEYVTYKLEKYLCHRKRKT